MASNTAVGHQMALGDTLGDTARGQQQPMVVPWFIYSGQGVTPTPDPEDPPGRTLGDNWVAPAHPNVGCWRQKQTSRGQFFRSLSDPHRTPASRLRPTAIAVSELLTAALAGPAQILLMY